MKTNWKQILKLRNTRELYLKVIVISASSEWFYQAIEDLIWDKYTKILTNRPVITMKNFGHIICQKQSPEVFCSKRCS